MELLGGGGKGAPPSKGIPGGMEGMGPPAHCSQVYFLLVNIPERSRLPGNMPAHASTLPPSLAFRFAPPKRSLNISVLASGAEF